MHTIHIAAAALVAASGALAAPATLTSEYILPSASLVNRCRATATLYSRTKRFGYPDILPVNPGEGREQLLGDNMMWEIYNEETGPGPRVNFDYTLNKLEIANSNSDGLDPPANLYSFYTTSGFPFENHIVTLNHSHPECVNRALDKSNRWDTYCWYNSSVLITLCDDDVPPSKPHERRQQLPAPTQLPTHHKYKPWAGTRFRPPNMPPNQSLGARAAPGQMVTPRSGDPSEPTATWPVTWDPNGAVPTPDALATKSVPWPLPWDPNGAQESPAATPQVAKRQDQTIARWCPPKHEKTGTGHQEVTIAPWCPPRPKKTPTETPQGTKRQDLTSETETYTHDYQEPHWRDHRTETSRVATRPVVTILPWFPPKPTESSALPSDLGPVIVPLPPVEDAHLLA